MIKAEIFQKMIEGMWGSISSIGSVKNFLQAVDEQRLDYFQEAQMRSAIEVLKEHTAWVENTLNWHAPKEAVKSEIVQSKCAFCGHPALPDNGLDKGSIPLCYECREAFSATSFGELK